MTAVGKQSTRSGLFGATYHPHLPGFFLASRPALRMWLAEDVTGNVLRTLPFAFDRTGESLGRLFVFGTTNLVSVSETTLLFLDLEGVKVTQAVRDWQSIRHVAVCGDVCFVCCNSGSLFSVGKPQRLLKKMSSILSQLVQAPVAVQPVIASPPVVAAAQVHSIASEKPTSAQPAAPPPAPFDSAASSAAARICSRCNDVWRGISLESFAPPEQDLTLLQRAWGSKSSGPPPQYYGALLCVHVLLQVWLPPSELSVEEFVAQYRAEVMKNERVVEAVLAALSYKPNQFLLDSFHLPSSLFCRVSSSSSCQVAPSEAHLFAQKYPGISDELFLSRVQSKESKREYLAALLGLYYPLLATPQRMEMFVNLCEPNPEDGKWPHDALLFSFCSRCKSGGELLFACRRARYYRGLLDIDYNVPHAFAEQFSVVVEINDVRRAAVLLERKARDQSCWETAFRLCSPDSAVDLAFVLQQALIHARPPQMLARVLANVPSVGADTAATVAVLASKQQVRAAVATSVLEAVDVHLWAKHNPHVLPQAAAAASLRDGNAQVARAAAWPRDGPANVSFDEMPSHWGVKISASDCGVCRTAAAGPMRVFRCGHVAHNECSTEEACSVCFVTQIKSIKYC